MFSSQKRDTFRFYVQREKIFPDEYLKTITQFNANTYNNCVTDRSI